MCAESRDERLRERERALDGVAIGDDVHLGCEVAFHTSMTPIDSSLSTSRRVCVTVRPTRLARIGTCRDLAASTLPLPHGVRRGVVVDVACVGAGRARSARPNAATIARSVVTRFASRVCA